MLQQFSAQTAQTLMCIRGNAVVSIDGPVDGDKVVVGIGSIVVTDDAAAAGVASVPHPVTDGDAPWQWVHYYCLQAQAGTGVGASLNAMSVVERFEWDSKAMRKLRINESLVFVAEAVSQAGTPGVDITSFVRALFAL